MKLFGLLLFWIGISGTTMKEILHATVMTHKRTPGICRMPLLAHSCSLDDLLQFNEAETQCVEQWKTAV